MSRLSRTGAMLAVASAWAAADRLALGQAATQPRASSHSAVTPVDRTDERWVTRNESLNARARKGGIDLIFLGDSITQGWEGVGKEVWAKHYAPRRALNLGISGDRTQHVLWRLDHGNLDGLVSPDGAGPKLIVLMIGTNNSNGDDNTAAEIADGIKAIVEKLRARLPKTKILMLAIFPRGETPNPQRDKNAEASLLASKIGDGDMVHYLDIGARFLSPDGTLSKDIMPDGLHLSPRGYEIWAEAIDANVEELMER